MNMERQDEWKGEDLIRSVRKHQRGGPVKARICKTPGCGKEFRNTGRHLHCWSCRKARKEV